MVQLLLFLNFKRITCVLKMKTVYHCNIMRRWNIKHTCVICRNFLGARFGGRSVLIYIIAAIFAARASSIRQQFA